MANINVMVAIACLVGSVGLYLWAWLAIQMGSDFAIGLGLAYANFLGLVLALAGQGLAMMAFWRDRRSSLARTTMIAAMLCVVAMAALLMLSHGGAPGGVNGAGGNGAG